jgi:hypothetical protein
MRDSVLRLRREAESDDRDELARESLLANARSVEEDIREDDSFLGEFRRQMRRSNVEPPPLPPELAHIDDRTI